MIDYQRILSKKYPSLEPNVDYEIHYWPGGPNPAKGGQEEPSHHYLVWMSTEPEPTMEELDAWAKDNEAQLLADELAEVKAVAVESINDAAEEQRGEWITLRAGKIGEYQQKKEEVERYIALGKPTNPDPIDFPIAAAESKEYKITIVEMLTTWQQKATASAQASAKIAACERKFLLAVEAATTVEEVDAVIEQLRVATSSIKEA
jgi:hypothetical protein